MYLAVDRANATSTGNVGMFALPVAENVCETMAPSTQKITVGGAAPVAGDVNGDGEVTGSDVTALYNHILFGQDTEIFNGDQNGDGEVTGSDVTAVYNIILGL